MNPQRLSRFLNIHPIPNDWRVLIVGCGGIGSNAYHLLVSMGVTDFTLVDHDEVNDENVFPGFLPGPTGVKKAQALADWGRTHDVVSTAIMEWVEDAYIDDDFDLILVGTDNLESRRFCFSKLRHMSPWLIDGRMGGTSAAVLTIPTSDDDIGGLYWEYLQGNNTPLECGMKATAMLTKGFIVGMIGQSVYDILHKREPFYYQSVDLKMKSDGITAVTMSAARQASESFKEK